MPGAWTSVSLLSMAAFSRSLYLLKVIAKNFLFSVWEKPSVVELSGGTAGVMKSHLLVTPSVGGVCSLICGKVETDLELYFFACL